MTKIIAVIPAYNEERFIASVVLKTRKFSQLVIVVDDGSSDFTAELAAEAGAEVIRHEQNLGKGAALATGFNHARQYSPEVVVTLDADGQHCPEEIVHLIQPILSGEADIVVGSRYLQPNSLVPRSRVWGHRFFNLFTRVAAGVTSSDSQSGFRAFSPHALRTITFRSGGFSVESEMQFIARENDLKLVEVPITISYPDRPKRSVVAHGMGVFNGVLRLIGQYRPLLFFGLPGLILLLVGLIWGFVVVNIYSRTQSLAVGYAMISVLTTMIGMLMLATAVILHSIRGLLIDFYRHGKLE
jgi:glycosyltransferase involved in cell wall biosynthesis